MWELIKSNAAEFSKKYSKLHSEEQRVEKFNLYKLFADMQDHVIEHGINERMEQSIKKVSEEINSFETLDAKKSAFWCKCYYYQYGEVPSKFFFNMEKRKYTNKTMYQVRKSDGTLTKNYSEILHEQYKFYEKLYTMDPQVQFDLINNTGVMLDGTQKATFDKPFTQDELFDALMTLKTGGKCPGPDSLTLAFYRKFWAILKEPLFDALIESVEEGRLNFSARRGIINLIPKKQKDETLLKNWRPISLLNYDYKSMLN